MSFFTFHLGALSKLRWGSCMVTEPYVLLDYHYLHQGSFSVRTIDGEQIITNGHNLAQQSSRIISNDPSTSNSAVQLPLAVSINNPAQARLSDFINSVRAYNAQ